MALSGPLKHSFGDELTIKYVDVIDDDLEEYPAVEKFLAEEGMQLPLVSISGRLFPGLPVNFKDLSQQIALMFKK